MKRIFAIIMVIAVLCTALVGCNKEVPNNMAALPDWMQDVRDDTPITRMAIPGSHDSGTIGMMSLAKTQRCSIKEQLEGGVRYFDIRVNAKDDGVIFHGPINGVAFKPIADDIMAFMQAHPTEFLILDFQHFKNGGETLVYDTLKAVGLLDIAVANTTDMADATFIDTLTLGNVRGKVFIFFGNDMANDYDNIFLRNNDECTREGASLDSLYLGKEHKKGSEHFIDSALPQYIKHIKERGTGILVLQGQLTAPNFFVSPLSLETKHSDNMNAYTRAIKDNMSTLKIVNVIMRDAVEEDAEKVLSILSLNSYKGYIKDGAKARFDKLCNIL